MCVERRWRRFRLGIRWNYLRFSFDARATVGPAHCCNQTHIDHTMSAVRAVFLFLDDSTRFDIIIDV